MGGSVTATLTAGTRVQITARQFNWIGDEPLGAGGTDEGPTPYELLLGSLAACIAITMRLYTQHKGIELDRVDVRLEFDRVHADDCENCDDDATGFIEQIRASVTVAGTFDEAQRKRLTQVAKRCPVHKTLAAGVNFVDEITFEPA